MKPPVEDWLKRPLSRHAIATLRYIRDHDVLTQHLGQVHQGTLGALLKAGHVERLGSRITLSASGEDMLNEYSRATWNARRQEGPLTDRVKALLRYANALRIVA